MLLHELFNNTTTKWKWGFRGSQEAEATFVVGDVQYHFYAYSHSAHPTEWEVEFRAVEGVDPRNKFGITGTGNSAQVLSTVVEILREFLQKYKDKITVLTFSAKEGSRRDLYARMVRRLLPAWAFKLDNKQFFLTAPTDNKQINETTEEDRALISLSSAIYDKVKTYENSDSDELVRVGTIGDMFDTSIPALDKVGIGIQGGEQFMQNATQNDDASMDWSGKVIYAFWDEETHSVIINKDHINTHRMKTTITHELRHALDEVKSGSFPGDAKGYFTPKKKEHRKADPYSTLSYRAQPAEINARFVEILDILSKRIPLWYNKLDAQDIKKQLSTDFKNLLNKYEIADIFPEKTQSPDYKRLVKRAYDFIQKEMAHVESELAKKGTPKKATGGF